MDGQVSLIPAESDTARKDYSPYPTCVQIDSYDDMRPTEDSDEYWWLQIRQSIGTLGSDQEIFIMYNIEPVFQELLIYYVQIPAKW